MTKSVHVNLTPYFVAWSVLFVVLGLVTGAHSLFWVAAAPWLLSVAFGVVVFLFASGTLLIMYFKGYPITLTTPRKGERVVQRGRAPRYTR